MTGAKKTVYVRRKTNVQNSIGGWDEKWSEIKLIVGTLTPPSGGRQVFYDREGVRVDREFYFKNIPGFSITEQDRIRHGEDVYRIRFVNDYGTHTELALELER